MKKQIKTLALAILTTMLFTNAQAQSTAEITSPQVSYIGLQNNKVAFNVKFDNTLLKNVELELVNENGYILYSKKFTDKAIDKTIVIKNESGNDELQLNFIIRAGGNVFNTTFNVSTITKTVNETEVIRL